MKQKFSDPIFSSLENDHIKTPFDVLEKQRNRANRRRDKKLPKEKTSKEGEECASKVLDNCTMIGWKFPVLVRWGRFARKWKKRRNEEGRNGFDPGAATFQISLGNDR